MELVKRFFGTEFRTFWSLEARAKALLVSYAVREIANPMYSLFINAFLFRSFGGVIAPALYNIGIFVGLPLGMLANGRLLRKYRVSSLYLFGAIIQSLSLLAVIIVGPESLPGVLCAGVVYGLGNGIYWGNRNFLTMDASEDKARNYFTALELSTAKIVGILAPVLTGWLLVTGQIIHLYSVGSAYEVLAVVAFLLQLCAAWIVTRFSYPTPKVEQMIIRKAGLPWRKMRLFAFLAGLSDGAQAFFPALIVFMFLGDEASLGTLQSLSTLMTALVLYFIGRASARKDRPLILLSGLFLIILGSAVFGLLHSSLGAIIYVLVVALGAALFATSWRTIFYAAADEDRIREDKRYAKIVDHEIFLSAGRIAGAGVFLLTAVLFGASTSLRFVPVILALFMAGTFSLSRWLSRDSL